MSAALPDEPCPSDAPQLAAERAEGGGAVTGEQPALSKKAQKRLAKMQARKEIAAQKKLAKKESRKAETAKRREEAQKYLEQLSEEEQAKLKEANRLKRQKRAQDAAQQKQRLRDAMLSGQHIVVDLDFEAKMTEKEVKSLCQQMAYCYAVNSRSETPAHLHFTSYTPGIRRVLEHQSTGCNGWSATFSDEPYIDIFAGRKQDLVYLSADASETLETLDPGKVYIIGGIVDRNRYKRLCQEKADGQGIATAKLPLEQHVKLDGTNVLTVNQVYAILLRWLACKDWAQAVEEAVPERKRAAKGDGKSEKPEEPRQDAQATGTATSQNAG